MHRENLALPDTGSNYTILDSAFARAQGFVVDSSAACSVQSVNNSPVSVIGTCQIKINPTDRKDVCSFLGLAVQLGNFLPDLAHNTTLLRQLTSEKNAFL